MLVRPVGVQESPGQVGDGLALPGHHHPGALRDHRHGVCLQVFRLSGGDEAVRVLRGHHHCHALLALRDGQFGAVQAVILLAYRVQVDAQAGGQLADSHGDAAGAEVVAPLDHAGNLAVPEEALDLPLLGGVALLDLAGHGGEGSLVVALGGAGGSADAVPAGAAAQQDDHVPGGRTLPHHVGGRRGAHHGAHLQVLGHIAIVVHLGHMAGGQADLVAVGRVAGGSGGGQLALGQLALHGPVIGGAGVTAPGQAQSLIHIGPAGKRVPDAAADAGGRAAEGFDLGGVVVGLVLEHEQPVLRLPVHRGSDVDGTGVDLLRLVQVLEQAPLFQHLGSDGGQVHQGLGPGRGLLRSVHLRSGGEVAAVGGVHRGVQDLHPVDVGGKGGMAAVVRPVGIHHTDLRDGGVPLLLIPEIGLEELQVVQVHGQPQLGEQAGQSGLVQGGKALDHGHMVGGLVGADQGGRLVHGGLPALYRVDEVAADLVQILLSEPAAQQVHLGVGDQGAVHPGHELDALGGGVGPLVELPWQGLHRQDAVGILGDGESLVIHRIHLGLGEDDALGLLIDRGVDLVGVVAVQNDHRLQAADAQLVPQSTQQPLGLHIESGLFL